MDPNPSIQPEQAAEARLTALLLGELSAEEAEVVRRELASKPELAALHARLERTIRLVSEAVRDPVERDDQAEVAPPGGESPRLSSPRREQLLGALRGLPEPKLAVVSMNRELPWFIPMSLAAMLVALIGGAALMPEFWFSVTKSRQAAISAPARASGDSKALAEANSDYTLGYGLGSEERFSLARQMPEKGLPVITTPPPASQPESGAKLDKATAQREGELSKYQVASPPSERAGGIAQGIVPGPQSTAGTSSGVLSVEAVGWVDFDKNGADHTWSMKTGDEVLAEGRPAENRSRLPVLGDVPVPGRFFRGQAIPAEPAKPAVDRLQASLEDRSERRSGMPVSPPVNSPADAPTVAGEPPGQAGAIAGGLRTRFGGLAPAITESAAVPELKQQVESIRQLDRHPAAVALSTADGDHLSAEAPPHLDTDGLLPQAQAVAGQALLGTVVHAVRDLAEGRASVEIARKGTDTSSLNFDSATAHAFDPYFVQTEVEKVKSKKVLNQVIDELKLNEAWGDYSNSQPLSREEAYRKLAEKIDVRQNAKTSEMAITVKAAKPDEAALIANTVAKAYAGLQTNALARTRGKDQAGVGEAENGVRLAEEGTSVRADQPNGRRASSVPAPTPQPQPEIQTASTAFSTFSLNVTDVSFRLAAASLEQGALPDPASIRSEEFLNAFDYRDPEPMQGTPVAFAWERAQCPFAQNRDLLRFSIKTAAQGRPAGRALNLVVLLDRSGSMERADRVRIVQEALRVLAGQLGKQDKLSVITFARTPRLWVDGVSGDQAEQALEEAGAITPEGGTNLEAALDLAYETARKHYAQAGVNRVVMLTDGAANLGDVNPDALQRKVETHRRQGIALDCFGVGWEGFADELLQVLSSSGDGRYGFLNSPDEAAIGFAGQLAGAFQVAAANVKVQVEFNPKRVVAYRQIGYAKHQLTKQQFRDNTVDAAEIGAAESGNGLYVVQVDPNGEGDLGVVRVRFQVPATGEFQEREWPVPYTGSAVPLEQASPALRLAAVSTGLAEWLARTPYGSEITPDRLLALMRGVPQTYGSDYRPRLLETMIRETMRLK
ncbi:MAG: von Willebrand factor type A domain-containing protein [Verrucomicrobiia bacterium]